MRNKLFHNAPSDNQDEIAAKLEEKYKTIDSLAADKIFTDKASLGPVVMLQEHIYKVDDTAINEREEVKKLTDTFGYKIHKFNDKVYGPNISIAIDPARFDFIGKESKTFESGNSQALMVHAKDKNTGKQVTFVSVVIMGSSLTGSLAENEKAGKSSNQDCKDIIVWINANAKGSDYICLGGDFNANPEKLPSRFKLFEDAGFKLSRTGKTTQLNYDPTYGKDYNERELDFLMVREQPKTLYARILRSISPLKFKSADISKATTLGTFAVHGSDHAPIQATVKTTEYEPLFMNLVGRIRRLVK